MQTAEKAWRGVGFFCAAALAVSLVPLFLIGWYAHPCADDFSYGFPTALAWSSSVSFLEVLESALQNTGRIYQNWQGSFAAVFLMSLQPAIFWERMYFWGVVFLLSTYLAGFLFFLKVFLRNYAGVDRTSYCVVSSLVLLVAVQYRYSPVEGFYWFNGGIYYTFFHASALVLLGLCLLLLKESRKPLSVIYFLLSCAFAFLIGGGNYTTALTVTLLLFFCMAWLFLRKEKKAVWIGVILLFLLIPFFISIFSPGNTIRQESVGAPSPIRAILLSFVYGAYSIFNATTVPALVLWFFLIPILFHAAKKAPILSGILF